jgi:hypothetical protein
MYEYTEIYCSSLLERYSVCMACTCTVFFCKNCCRTMHCRRLVNVCLEATLLADKSTVIRVTWMPNSRFCVQIIWNGSPAFPLMAQEGGSVDRVSYVRRFDEKAGGWLPEPLRTLWRWEEPQDGLVPKGCRVAFLPEIWSKIKTE